jgi:hypothetical protein
MFEAKKSSSPRVTCACHYEKHSGWGFFVEGPRGVFSSGLDEHSPNTDATRQKGTRAVARMPLEEEATERLIFSLPG